jgi:hypothetical protein
MTGRELFAQWLRLPDETEATAAWIGLEERERVSWGHLAAELEAAEVSARNDGIRVVGDALEDAWTRREARYRSTT